MRQVGYLASVTLSSGRVISLDRYEMSMTYAGLIEGVPQAGDNDRTLLRLAEDLIARHGRPVHVIDPPRENHGSRGSARRGWQSMPPVQCVGVFDSAPLRAGSDPDFDWSSLVIAWFQQEPQFPVGPDALPALQAVDWESLAVDCWA